MESLNVKIDADLFDRAVHGGLDENPVLAEAGDLAIYAKPNATVQGNGMVVITFTVRCPDGTMARAQAVTTAKLFAFATGAVRGWVEGGPMSTGNRGRFGKPLFGATGQFPRGKHAPDDEGELRVGVTHVGATIRVDFGKPVAWLAMSADEALVWAAAMRRRALMVKAMPEEDIVRLLNAESAALELVEAAKLALSVWRDHLRGSVLEAAVAKAEGKS